MKTRKKRAVLKYKTFNNLSLSTNIFNTLKKFREKKQVAIWFNANSFDFSSVNQIEETYLRNNFNQQNFTKYKVEHPQNLTEEEILIFTNLDYYLNTIIAYSFCKNIYHALKNDKVLNERVKSDLWANIRNNFNLTTSTINHRLELNFYDLYSYIKYENLRSFESFIIKRTRKNSVLKQVYFNTIQAVQNLIEYLQWNIVEKNKVYQCSLTGFYKRFGDVQSFYKEIPYQNLKHVLNNFNISFFGGDLSRVDNEFYCANHLLRGSNFTFGYYDSDLSRSIKAKYISSKKTVIFNVDQKTLDQFPSVNLESNNNQLRPYSFKVVDGLPFAQMPYEKVKENNLYLGVELEVNKSSRCPSKINKMLEEKILSGTAICKSDGSLGNNGLELNIVPMTLDYAKQTDYWFNFEKNVKDYLYSYRDKKTGVHVHIPKHLFTRYQIGLIGQFLNLQSNFKYICEIAGRDLENDTSYARVNYRHNIKYFARNLPDRHSILNTEPEKTIEFRMFKGNISGHTIYRYLEFTHALATYVRSNSMNSKTSHKDFIKWVSKNRFDYPILNKFHFRNTNNNKYFKKVESFKLTYKRRFKGISFNVPSLKLSEPLRFRRVRAIRTRTNIPSSLNQPQQQQQPTTERGTNE